MGDDRRPRTAIALAIAVGLLVAGALGRLTAPGSESPAPVIHAMPAPLARGAAAGVPVGYARTRAGSVAAMAAYGQALADPRVQLDDRRRRAVAAAVGTRRYARALDDAQPIFDARRQGAVGRALRPGAHAVFLGLPIAYRVLSYDGSRAVIKSWGVAIAASDSGIEPRASWGTITTTAVWQRDDWKVDEVRTVPGPVPADTDTPTAAPAFIDALREMRSMHHAP